MHDNSIMSYIFKGATISCPKGANSVRDQTRIIDYNFYLVFFCALPTTVLLTFVANRKLHNVSPRWAASGETLHNIRVLLEPKLSAIFRVSNRQNSPDKLVCSNLVKVEFRYGT